MSIKKIIISGVLAGTMLLPSCASNQSRRRHRTITRTHSSHLRQQRQPRIQTGARPAWVDGHSSEFPKDTYLTAVGYAKSRKMAEENARMEMSQIFNTQIKAIRTSTQNVNSKRKNGKVKLSAMEFEAQTKIKNSTEAIFSGLELVRYWKSKDGTIYVLAVINKRKVLPPLKEKIMKIDNVIEQLVSEAKNSNDKLEALVKLNKALKKAVLREYYNSQVAILSSMGQTVSTEYDVQTLLYMIDDILSKINIEVAVSGEGNKTIRYAIIRALSESGLKVNDNIDNFDADAFEDFGEDADSKVVQASPNVDIIIQGEVSFRALDRGDNHKWVSGEVKLTLKNNKNGKIYNSLIISKKVRRLTLQDARRMAGIKIVKALLKELRTNLIGIIGEKSIKK